MTQEQFDNARYILAQIDHIDEILEVIDEKNYECAPPTRSTSWTLRLDLTDSKATLELNEGEFVCIREALRSQKAILQRDFDRL